jgi:hypothetical protein
MAIIKNYGLRWVRDRVFWGSGGLGNAGALEGCRVGAKRSVVDFREQIGIYILFEANMNPVYVGQAGFGKAALFTRLKQHRNDHLRDRWTHFSWFGFRRVNADGSLNAKQVSGTRNNLTYAEALNEMEGLLIHVLEPNLNRQGAAWRYHAVEYIQEGREGEADTLADVASDVSEIRGRLTKLEGVLLSAEKLNGRRRAK